MKSLIQNLIRHCGYDLFKHDARHHEGFCRVALLQKYHNLVVLDVGANVGQYGSELRSYGFDGKIISFEPQQSAHEILCRKSAGDKYWEIAERVAIGDKTCAGEINLSANSVSSSMLALEQVHLDIAPESAFIGTEKVKVVRLDDIVADHTNRTENFYLKVDTQGFEKHVLDGAPSILSRCSVVELELSVKSTYSGCLLLRQGIEYMEDRGFTLYSMYQVLQDRKTGALLQVNAFFSRPEEG